MNLITFRYHCYLSTFSTFQLLEHNNVRLYRKNTVREYNINTFVHEILTYSSGAHSL